MSSAKKSLTRQGKTPNKKNTPVFNSILATNKSRDSSKSPHLINGLNHDGLVSPAINNLSKPNNNDTSSVDLDHLIATAAFGGGSAGDKTG